MLQHLLYILFQTAVSVMLAPLLCGIIKKIKAFSQKRKGPPVLQLYIDLYKLAGKDTVISDTSSWIFRAAPYIVLSTALAGMSMMPVTTAFHSAGFTGDAILLVYLLALGRFFMMLSGLDTGSAFTGMGSSREAMVSVLIEPSLLVVIFTAGLVSKSTSLYKMAETADGNGGLFMQPAYIFLFLAVIVIILAETSRIPVDDPATHLELTMVHEAMLLEYSGRHLAMMELGSAVKQMIFITLLVNLFIPSVTLPHTLGLVPVVAVSIMFFIIKAAAAAAMIAAIEVGTVKFKLFSVPNLAVLSFILAFIGFIQYFVAGG